MKLISNLSVLTTIPENYLDKLVDKSIWSICDAVEVMLEERESDISIDIGIGTLKIKNADDSIGYYFIPSKELEDAVRSTAIEKKNLLKLTLERNLVNKIIHTYKDIF